MSQLELEYTGTTSLRIDMRWLSAAIGAHSKLSEIEHLPMQLGSRKVSVADLFKVSGQANATSIRLHNANPGMDFVGHSLPAGSHLTVDGSCGHFTGAELRGGRLVCELDAGNYTGCAMRSGIIEIKGNCQDYTGGAYSGRQRGMRGGTILIRGNSGQHTGDLMRRGTILVEGNMGAYTASRMIAGTISNLGEVGDHLAVGMKRGTLLLPSLPKQKIPLNFTDAGRHNLGYLTLLLNEIRQHESRFKKLHPMRRRIHRYIGDRACNGLGELLIWVGGLESD